MKGKTKKKDCCAPTDSYPSHATQLPRLNRIAGQMEGVRKMIEERRYCPDILTQLRAARAAINALEADILEVHMTTCLAQALASGSRKEREEKIAEMKNIYRRFNG